MAQDKIYCVSVQFMIYERNNKVAMIFQHFLCALQSTTADDLHVHNCNNLEQQFFGKNVIINASALRRETIKITSRNR